MEDNNLENVSFGDNFEVLGLIEYYQEDGTRAGFLTPGMEFCIEQENCRLQNSYSGFYSEEMVRIALKDKRFLFNSVFVSHYDINDPSLVKKLYE
ncbi:hypothetical protein JW887_06685 [Candidatus Dojkabacteria bacterium]|nr:hypothetical protein [Candidatus Dojkabacteria bacterium]